MKLATISVFQPQELHTMIFTSTLIKLKALGATVYRVDFPNIYFNGTKTKAFSEYFVSKVRAEATANQWNSSGLPTAAVVPVLANDIPLWTYLESKA